MVITNIILIKRRIDLNVHSGPLFFSRPFVDLKTDHRAAEAGIVAIWLKDYFESTIGES